MKQVAVLGNTNWQNRRKAQKTLMELKHRFNDDVTVLGAGYNLYSAMPKSYYGKQYHFSQLHHRMKLLAQNCDYMIIMTNEETLDPVLKTAYNNTKKLNKPIVLLG